MIARIMALMIVCFGLAACSSSKNLADLIDDQKNGVVAIVAKGQPQAGTDKIPTGLGTGFIIGENFIVTNYHVAGDKNNTLQVGIETNDKMYDAELVFGDEKTDIAVIKIKDWATFTKENPHIKILQWSNVRPREGDEIFVIGHPWGLFYSISRGIISHEGRKSPLSIPTWWIQSDAHIYQGNSGGPMFDIDGNIIGMNSIMISQEGGSYGFALPTPLIKKVISDLEKYKEVRWASLGVGLKGSSIMSVAPGSAADKAGIKVNDTITSISTNNQELAVNTAIDLIIAMSLIDYQQEVTLGIKRDKDDITIKVVPGYKLNTDYK